MPIYEYICRGCGNRFSKLQKMGSEGDGTACPQCESLEVERQISACAIGAGESKGSSAPACSIGGG